MMRPLVKCLFRLPLLTLVGGFLLLSVAACSGYGAAPSQAASPAQQGAAPAKGTPPAESKPPATKAARTLEVGLDDFTFEPKDLVFSAGQAIVLTLKNKGRAPHTFTISDLGIDVTIQPGATQQVTFTPEKAGSFRLVCRFHEARGMAGSVKVEGAGAAPKTSAGTAPATTPSSSGSSYRY